MLPASGGGEAVATRPRWLNVRRGEGLSVANMAPYAISSSLILVIQDNMINGTNQIV
jgi:hypothetical protein